MIKYSLICKCEYTFDSWFSNSKEFERLKRANLIACIKCNSTKVEKSIMAPSVSNSKKLTSDNSQLKKNLKKKIR